MTTKVFVGGLSWGTTEDSLRTFFSQIGKVVSAIIITDRATGKSKGFGFVEMGTEAEAKEAMEKLNGQDLDGRRIAVVEARPQAPREDRFSRSPQSFGGGGGGNKRNWGDRGDRGFSGGGGDFRRRDQRGPRRGFGGDRRGRRPSSYR